MSKMLDEKGMRSVVLPRGIVLVGTYRDTQMKRWILPKGYYNYPVGDGDDCTTEHCQMIKELWLYKGTSGRRIFSAKFLGVKTRDELPDYPATKEKPHSDKYLLFKVEELYGPQLEDAVVHVRVSDFTKRTPKIAAAVKAFQEGKGAEDLFEYLPTELSTFDGEQLKICEGVLQLNFFDEANKRDQDAPLGLENFWNRTVQGDSAEVMRRIPSDSVDMIVTSPPYDSIRDYKGFSLDLSKVGMQAYRVLKDGGVAVVVIQDQTKNFGKSLTSFKLAIDWCENAGFKLFECLIYKKFGAEGAWWNKRFRVDHEYMMVFLKGERPGYFNKEPLKIPSKHGGKTMTGGGTRLTNGIRIATRAIHINPMKCRGTIWAYETAGDGSRLKHEHPATYPDKLPYDFIQCFCPEGGVVLDPFMGSGTTALAAKALGRNFLGIDISQEYVNLSQRRVVEDYAGYMLKVAEWKKPPILPTNQASVANGREIIGQKCFALFENQN